MTDRKDSTDDGAAAPAQLTDTGEVETDASADVSTDGATDNEFESVEGPASASSSGKPWLLPLVAVAAFVLGGAATAYWMWTELQAVRTELAGVGRDNEQRTDALRTEMRGISEAADTELGAAVGAANDRIAVLGEVVDTFNLRLTEAEQAQPQALVTAEVEYLVVLAANRLQLERDRPGALLAIDRALARLAVVDSPAHAGLVSSLVDERRQLQQFEAPDLDEIVRQLSELVASVDQIDVRSEKLSPDANTVPSTADAAQSWQGFVSAVSANLKQFVQVEKAAGVVAPTLIPDQDYYARENIRLSLQVARSAALRADHYNLTQSLEEAKRWLAQFVGCHR